MSYEFTPEEEKEFTELSRILTMLAVLFVLYGVFGIFFSLNPPDILSILYSIAIILAGIFFYLPTDNLRLIASTEGNDIKELMQAFKEMNTGWDYIIVLFGILCVITLISIFV